MKARASIHLWSRLSTSVLLSAFLLTGCSGVVNPAAEASYEKDLADKTVAAEKTSQKYAQIHKMVSEAPAGSPGAEKEIKALLKKADLSDLDRAILSYQLARYQSYQKQYEQANKNFDVALSLMDSMKTKPQNLIRACYFSYYRSLSNAGHSDEANEFKARFNMHPATKVAGE